LLFTEVPRVEFKPAILQHFTYDHLPFRLQQVSKPFGELAASLVATLPDNPERAKGLDKLLEAKDCAVRAFLTKE
jgi:ferritin-like protein